MVVKRKFIGYYLKKGRVLKAYVKFNKKTKKYGKTRYSASNKKLIKGTRVYKKKSTVPKPKPKKVTKSKSRKLKFGMTPPSSPRQPSPRQPQFDNPLFDDSYDNPYEQQDRGLIGLLEAEQYHHLVNENLNRLQADTLRDVQNARQGREDVRALGGRGNRPISPPPKLYKPVTIKKDKPVSFTKFIEKLKRKKSRKQ